MTRTPVRSRPPQGPSPGQARLHMPRVLVASCRRSAHSVPGGVPTPGGRPSVGGTFPVGSSMRLTGARPSDLGCYRQRSGRCKQRGGGCAGTGEAPTVGRRGSAWAICSHPEGAPRPNRRDRGGSGRVQGQGQGGPRVSPVRPRAVQRACVAFATARGGRTRRRGARRLRERCWSLAEGARGSTRGTRLPPLTHAPSACGLVLGREAEQLSPGGSVP